MNDELAKVIPLFKNTPPPTVDPITWEWGADFVESGVNNLAQIVDDIQAATTERELLVLIADLKAEVATYPDPFTPGKEPDEREEP